MTFLEFLETFFDDGFGTVVELGGNDLSFAGKLLSRSTGLLSLTRFVNKLTEHLLTVSMSWAGLWRMLISGRKSDR